MTPRCDVRIRSCGVHQLAVGSHESLVARSASPPQVHSSPPRRVRPSEYVDLGASRATPTSMSLDLRRARLRINATYVSSAFTRRSDGERTAFTRIPRVKVEYQLARPLFVRVVSQYTATSREALEILAPARSLGSGAAAPSTASSSNALRTDWLLYRPAPGTVFFLGYGGTLNEPDRWRCKRSGGATIRFREAELRLSRSIKRINLTFSGTRACLSSRRASFGHAKPSRLPTNDDRRRRRCSPAAVRTCPRGIAGRGARARRSTC
jgi:hypothetical protein